MRDTMEVKNIQKKVHDSPCSLREIFQFKDGNEVTLSE